MRAVRSLDTLASRAPSGEKASDVTLFEWARNHEKEPLRRERISTAPVVVPKATWSASGLDVREVNATGLGTTSVVLPDAVATTARPPSAAMATLLPSEEGEMAEMVFARYFCDVSVDIVFASKVRRSPSDDADSSLAPSRLYARSTFA
jgi:hypothetical protein